MLGGRVVSCLRLHQRGLGRVQIAARNGALGKELLAALHNALVQVEIGFGLRHVQFGLLRILGHLRLGGRGKSSLSRHVGALVILRRGGQVVVLKCRQQLAFLHARAALDVELCSPAR